MTAIGHLLVYTYNRRATSKVSGILTEKHEKPRRPLLGGLEIPCDQQRVSRFVRDKRENRQTERPDRQREQTDRENQQNRSDHKRKLNCPHVSPGSPTILKGLRWRTVVRVVSSPEGDAPSEFSNRQVDHGASNHPKTCVHEKNPSEGYVSIWCACREREKFCTTK